MGTNHTPGTICGKDGCGQHHTAASAAGLNETRTVKLTDELELWTYPDGRTVLHVEAEETATQARMFGEVNVPDVPELVRKLQAATPTPIVAGARWLEAFLHPDQPDREPVTHEATDPEWDEAATEYVLACTCGTWEARGTTEEITAEWERHLDAMGVPANDLEAIQRAESAFAAKALEAKVPPRRHQSALEVSRCWCRVAHGYAEAQELNRRAGL